MLTEVLLPTGPSSQWPLNQTGQFPRNSYLLTRLINLDWVLSLEKSVDYPKLHPTSL